MTKHIPALLAGALLAAAALTGCSSSGTPSTLPATVAVSPTPTLTATATPRRAEAIAKCIDAMVANHDNGDSAIECTSLSMDDYFDAIQEANKQGGDALQGLIDQASASATANG